MLHLGTYVVYLYRWLGLSPTKSHLAGGKEGYRSHVVLEDLLVARTDDAAVGQGARIHNTLRATLVLDTGLAVVGCPVRARVVKEVNVVTAEYYAAGTKLINVSLTAELQPCLERVNARTGCALDLVPLNLDRPDLCIIVIPHTVGGRWLCGKSRVVVRPESREKLIRGIRLRYRWGRKRGRGCAVGLDRRIKAQPTIRGEIKFLTGCIPVAKIPERVRKRIGKGTIVVRCKL